MLYSQLLKLFFVTSIKSLINYQNFAKFFILIIKIKYMALEWIRRNYLNEIYVVNLSTLP